MSGTTQTFTLSYDYQELATVTIAKNPKTDLLIKEMVEFWMNWERELRQHNGDHTKCWLMKLAMYILCHGRAPKDEEGWHPLDGSLGIWVDRVTPFEFDPNEIQIDSSEEL